MTTKKSLYRDRAELNKDVEKVMLSFCKNTPLPWTNTPTALYQQILTLAAKIGVKTDAKSAFPASPCALTRKLGEILPALNNANFDLFMKNLGNKRQITISLLELKQ